MRDEPRGIALMTVELGSRVVSDLLAENTTYIREAVVSRRIEAANPRAEMPTVIEKGDLSKYIDHYITLKGDDEKGNIYFVESITSTQDSETNEWVTRLSCEACWSPNDEPKRGTKWLIWESQVSHAYPENVMDWHEWEDVAT